MVEKSGVEMSFNRLFFLENLKMTRKRVKKVKLALAWIYFCDFRQGYLTMFLWEHDKTCWDLPDITFMFQDLWMAQSETDMIIIIILVPVPNLIHFSRRRSSKLLVLTIADIDQILLDIFLGIPFFAKFFFVTK